MIHSSEEHKWRFASQLRDWQIEDRFDYSSELKIPRPVVYPQSNYRLLFYCECGEMKTIQVSAGGNVSNYSNTVGKIT